MTILTMQRTGEATYGSALTLDALWDIAAKLGRIDVETEYSTKVLVVEIRFVRKASGSNIRATGKNMDVREAFRLAIEEAIALGAE